jgi:hypothetical protein
LGRGDGQKNPTLKGVHSLVVNMTNRSQALVSFPSFYSVQSFLISTVFIIISRVIVNKKERKLKKGAGFHLDLFIIGCLNGFCGIFGLPFMTAATVRSVTHVSALTVFSKTHAPGEKPKLLEVKEQRVTNFLVHVLIGE